MEVSPRLTRWIANTFPPDTRERVIDALRNLPPEAVGRQDPERVQAALVVTTGGDWERFVGMRDLALIDWRDALVAGGLAEPGWPQRLDEILNPPPTRRSLRARWRAARLSP